MYVNCLVCVVQSLALMVEVKQDQDMIYIYHMTCMVKCLTQSFWRAAEKRRTAANAVPLSTILLDCPAQSV
jgi:hypothetical protein